MSGSEPIFDGYGGDEEEYIMLHLRLSEGLDLRGYEEKFGEKISEERINRMKKYEKAGLLCIADGRIVLTPEGFLLSNSIIGEFLR